MHDARDRPAADAKFLTTRWSVVTSAAGQGDCARRSLEELCAAYWFPLYAFLRRRGSSHPEAEDRVQAFFLHILERRDLAQVSREKGRFRSWILTALRNFDLTEIEKARTQKRGGGVQHLSIDWESASSRFAEEPATDCTPEREFERAWALQLIEQAMRHVELDYMRRGRQELFEQLRHEIVPGAPQRSRADLAEALGLREGALKVALHRLRQRFGEALRREVAQTVASEEAVDQELADLMEVLGSA